MKKRVLIVIPCYRYFKGAVELVHSVKTKHEWQPFIVDNWRTNRGVSTAWNMGINYADVNGFDYALICNDDIIFAPDTIDQLVEEFENAPKDVAMITGHNVRAEFADPYAVLTLPKRTEGEMSQGPDFSCFMVKPYFAKQFGEFDVNFWPGYFEDNDMHYRMKLAGFKAMVTPRAPFYHIGSVTQNMDPAAPACPPEQFERNRGYFISKWGGAPDNEQWQHPYNDEKLSFKEWHQPQEVQNAI